jgi:hypothetical protein
MNLRKGLPSAFLQDADEVHDGVCALGGTPDRLGIAQVRLDEIDLADDAERLEEQGEVRPAHRNPDPVAPFRESPDDVAAEKAGAAEHGHEHRRLTHRVHDRLPPASPRRS